MDNQLDFFAEFESERPDDEAVSRAFLRYVIGLLDRAIDGHGSVEDAAIAMAYGAVKGCGCPVCGRPVKIRRLKLTNLHVRFLIALIVRWEATGRRAVHHTDIEVNQDSRVGGDYAKTALWGLAHTVDKRGRPHNRSGWWAPTQAGIEFAQGRRSAARYLYLYDRTIWHQSVDRVSIHEAIREEWVDLESMMDWWRAFVAKTITVG